MNASTHVQKLGNYCNTLRGDALSYGDHVEQLTNLLFPKVGDAKTKPPFFKHADLNEFVRLYRAENRLTREATFSETNPQGRWRSYGVDELLKRDKASLDLFWLRDDSLSGSDNLPAPEVIAAEIVEDLQAALEQLKELEAGLAHAPGI